MAPLSLDEVATVFKGANYCATLDLLQGVWHMPMGAEGGEAFMVGYRGTAATLQVPYLWCLWNSMEADVRSVVKPCLH